MKKNILAVVAVFAFGFVSAQDGVVNGFSKGSKFVEGTLSIYSSSSDTAVKSDSWTFRPTFGYMLDEQWAIGGKLDFGGDRYNAGLTKEVTNLGVTAFARYYFLTLGASKSFNAYGEAGLGYTSVKTDFVAGGNSTASKLNANISLGMNYFFSSHWAVVFELANVLSYNNNNSDASSNSSDLTIQVNMFKNIFAEPTFGLMYKW